MGLTFPVNASHANSQVAQNNLSVLICAKNTGEDVTSEVVRNAFQDYQNAGLGFGHYAKKFTASVAAYGAVLGLPVATVVGTTWWFFKDYIRNPVRAGTDLASALLNNNPAIDPNTPIIGGLSSYTTPSFCLGTLGAVAVVDRAFNEKTGVSPIKSVAKWTTQMMSTVLLYAAYKAGEMASASYLEEEEQSNTSRKLSHQKIIDELKSIYDHVAEEFFNEYEKVSDSPKDMIRFKNMALQLEENLPYIKSKLEELELRSFEVSQILNKLSASVSTIKDSALEFRQTRNENDLRFNIELLKTLAPKDISSIAIPKDIQNNIKIANYNDYGIQHKISACAEAAIKGLVVGVATDVTLVALFQILAQRAGISTIEILKRNFLTYAAFAGFFPAGALGIKIADSVMKERDEDRLKAEQRKEEHIQIAHEKLKNVYDGIAAYLAKKYRQSHYNPFAMDMLRNEARNILTKLPALEAEIAKVDIMPNRFDVTEKLREILVALA